MIPVVGATPGLERAIRTTLASLPPWFVRAARVARIEVSNRPEVRAQIAQYAHGTRVLDVSPTVGDVLRKALYHELAHGIDDMGEEAPHYFTSTPEWSRIHAEQMYFDIPKYAEQPLEYFADQIAKFLMLGPDKHFTTHPKESTFIGTWVVPTLTQAFQETT